MNRKIVHAMLATVLVGSLCAGCNLEVVEQRVRFGLSRDRDSVRLQLEYIGLDMRDKSKEDDSEIVRHAAAGGRIFGIVGWGAWDLDDLDLDSDDRIPEHLVALRAFLAGIRLESHGIYIDKDGRLCGYQRFVFDGIEKALAALNAAISESIQDLAKESKLEQEFGNLETGKLWLARAHGTEPWVRLEGDELVLDVPMPDAHWNSMQSDWLQTLVAKGDSKCEQLSLFAQAAAHLRGLERRDQRLILRFGTPDGPHFELHYRNPKPEYRGRLLATLVETGGIELKTRKELKAAEPDAPK